MEEKARSVTYDARITAVEVGIKGLSDAMQNFKLDVDGKFDHLLSVITAMRSDISTAGKAQWPTYIAALAVVLVIVGMVGSGYVRDQERTEKDVSVLQEKFQGHDANPGIHFSLRERVLNHELLIEKIDSQMSKVLVWQEKHAERAGQSHTLALEKIIALERRVFDGDSD